MQELLSKPWFIAAIVGVGVVALLFFRNRQQQPAQTTIVQREVNLDPLTALLTGRFSELQSQFQSGQEALAGLFQAQQVSIGGGFRDVLKALAETAQVQMQGVSAGLKAIDTSIASQFQQQQEFVKSEQQKQLDAINAALRLQQEENKKTLDAVQKQVKLLSDVNALVVGQNSFLACYDAKVGWRRECLFAKGTFGRSGLQDISRLDKAEEEAQQYAKCRKADKTFDLLCAGRQMLSTSFPDLAQTGGTQ